jgi:NADH:ubiquinone oxidoreductase subunit 2 (subunit N)
MYRWIVYLHVLGSFGFLLAHGASAFVAFRLRAERNLERIRTLLDLSVFSYNFMYLSLLALLAAGVIAGFMGRWWRMGWIWAALGVLVVVSVLMSVVGSLYYHRVRQAVGLPYRGSRGLQPPAEPASPGEIDALLRSSRPAWLAAIGGGGLAVILWLMMFKPF